MIEKHRSMIGVHLMQTKDDLSILKQHQTEEIDAITRKEKLVEQLVEFQVGHY